jgi:hypothetical protein
MVGPQTVRTLKCAPQPQSILNTQESSVEYLRILALRTQQRINLSFHAQIRCAYEVPGTHEIDDWEKAQHGPVENIPAFVLEFGSLQWNDRGEALHDVPAVKMKVRVR